MQIDIKRLYANIPMSIIAKAECKWHGNITSYDRSSPFIVMAMLPSSSDSVAE